VSITGDSGSVFVPVEGFSGDSVIADANSVAVVDV